MEPRQREQRKTVTVLFCDMTGSTALAESVDPEAVRALLARYFERMRAIAERHGGSVEKFVGDAVMAVFGVPVLHEDDALRAVRAAAEMREALPGLGVQARIGLNTGEVVTGTEERLATGDAVNVAARLEQAARPGEVLLGAETLRLVRQAIEVEEITPLRLKGKSEPVAAYRLVAVREVAERRPETPMVGRETELRRLRDALAQAVRNRSCQLFTVLGAAGVGKSRLAAEFLAGLEARVVRGRCLSYGEGITYWPVVEVVKQLDGLPAEAAAASALRSLLGETEASASAEELAWAFRKLLEERAQERPCVCVFDDLHWGEQTFLDLVEHVADLARDAPILVLCLARPELLERRPSWGGGKLNATTLLLEPLSDAETELLLDALGERDRRLRSRIRNAAEGNPLFVEEMLALMRESGGELAVPATIQALLAARLDQLEPAERSVLEWGAVEGEVFHRSAVEALAGGSVEVPARLMALVRKELLRPERAQRAGDDGFRFRHLLIRDAAYAGLPKTSRAELHQRFAAWLEHGDVELVEREEILGHHLEQAARYKAELGREDVELAERAGARLAAAGRRALWRLDAPAAEQLLERALELTRPRRLDVALELDLARALDVSDRRQAVAVAEAAAERARAAGDRPAELTAHIAAAQERVSLDAGFEELEAAEALAQEALPLLEHAGDHACLVHVWKALAAFASYRCRFEESAHAAEQALHHSRLAGQADMFNTGQARILGPRPADEALRTIDRLLPENQHPNLLLERAMLLAMLGRFDEAWPLAHKTAERLRELTGGYGGEDVLAQIATLEGDHAAAARLLRTRCDRLQKRGEQGFLSTEAPLLGRSLCALGRFDDAEPLARLGRELGHERDIVTQSLWRQVQARIDAHRGRHARAEQLGREAVALSEQTDNLNWQGDALCDLAQVLHSAGRSDEATTTFTQALERYERKRNHAMAAQVRERLAQLRAQALPT